MTETQLQMSDSHYREEKRIAEQSVISLAEPRTTESSFRMEKLHEYLFWDVASEEVDPERHSAWLVRRVLEYGDWSDWCLLNQYYGRDRLAVIVVGIRSLQPRSFAFCKVWFNLPASAFRCSTQPQSL